MKRGNQFYLEEEVYDELGNKIDINAVSKVQFNIGDLTKIYDGENTEVTYDEVKQNFKIYLSEAETFKLNGKVKMDARILYKNNLIDGTHIYIMNVCDACKEELLDVKAENS